jgi:hypothetical protein
MGLSADTLYDVIKAAYLRVYNPADGSEPRVDDPNSDYVLSDYGLISESQDDGFLMADWNDRTYACPRLPRIRVLEGLLAFRNSYPGLTAELLIPEEIAERAAAELSSFRDQVPDLRSHILTSPWHVPLRWFAAFEPDERMFLDGPRVLYRTDISRADDRLGRVLGVLRQSGFQDQVIDQVQELESWVGSFPADGMLELDYGGVVELFSEGELALDESAADIQASITALEYGNLDEAGDHYARAAARWAGPQALTYMN